MMKEKLLGIEYDGIKAISKAYYVSTKRLASNKDKNIHEALGKPIR
jgi:hypothetical protein